MLDFQFVPTRIGEMQDKQAIQVAACGFHSAVLTDNGQVWMFGEGKFGRLGNGTEENQLVPQMVEILNGIRIKQVACGGFHSCAIADSGEAVRSIVVFVLHIPTFIVYVGWRRTWTGNYDTASTLYNTHNSWVMVIKQIDYTPFVYEVLQAQPLPKRLAAGPIPYCST